MVINLRTHALPIDPSTTVSLKSYRSCIFLRQRTWLLKIQGKHRIAVSIWEPKFPKGFAEIILYSGSFWFYFLRNSCSFIHGHPPSNGIPTSVLLPLASYSSFKPAQNSSRDCDSAVCSPDGRACHHTCDNGVCTSLAVHGHYGEAPVKHKSVLALIRKGIQAVVVFYSPL